MADKELYDDVTAYAYFKQTNQEVYEEAADEDEEGFDDSFESCESSDEEGEGYYQIMSVKPEDAVYRSHLTSDELSSLFAAQAAVSG